MYAESFDSSLEFSFTYDSDIDSTRSLGSSSSDSSGCPPLIKKVARELARTLLQEMKNRLVNAGRLSDKNDGVITKTKTDLVDAKGHADLASKQAKKAGGKMQGARQPVRNALEAVSDAHRRPKRKNCFVRLLCCCCNDDCC